MCQAPTFSWCTNAIFNFKRITECIKLGLGSRCWLQRLPIPKIVSYYAGIIWFWIFWVMVLHTCTGDIIQMSHVAHTKEFFYFLNCSSILPRKDLVDVCNNNLNISWAILRHVFPFGFKILPEITTGVHTHVEKFNDKRLTGWPQRQLRKHIQQRTNQVCWNQISIWFQRRYEIPLLNHCPARQGAWNLSSVTWIPRFWCGFDVRTWVTTTQKNPRCFIWGHFVTIRLRKHNILCKVFEVIDSLLNCVKFQALGFQIVNRVA